MKYRAEIDGLRALAVVPVILFHAGFEVFSGGFVGVDVFFVISGYLITTILIEDIENDRFSLLNFYERRARRILPPLFFVMLACLPFAWMWMMPTQMLDYSQSLIAVSLFVSNILFWRETGYFDAASEDKPLLHTWSLAVEEQYYVFFPIFLFLTWRFGKNRVFWLIVVMATTSLLLSEWGWRNKATANFYLAPTRAWELFAGSIAAFIVQKNAVRKSEALSLLGLSAIVFSIFFYDERTPFPSLYALVPVLGVVLIILFARKETLVARLLSTKIFVGIGLISYSAYLWHQPLFAFARIRLLEESSALLMAGLSIISLLLAVVSWKFIETPTRRNKYFTRTAIFVGSFAMILLFVSLGALGHIRKGFETRMPINVVELDRFNTQQQRLRDAACNEIFGFKQRDRCLLGDKDNIRSVLIGDSHAHMLWHPLNQKLKHLGVGMISFTSADCPPILNVYRRDMNTQCALKNQEAFEYIKNNQHIDFVLLSGRWTLGVERIRFDNQEGGVEHGSDIILDIIRNSVKQVNSEENRKIRVLDNIKQSIIKIHDLDKKLYVVSPIPEVGFEPALKAAKKHILGDDAAKLTHSYDVFLERNIKVRSLFDELKEQLTPTRFYDLSKAVCNADTRRCDTFSAVGEPLYFDDDHLSSFGANIVADDFATWLKPLIR